MKSQTWIVVAVALLLGGLAGRFLSPSPSAPPAVANAHGAGATKAAPTVWTCSMHPQIRQPGPGKCPICAMDLIPLVTDASADEGPRVLVMSDSARALAEIQTTAVERRLPIATVRLVGKLDYDETLLRSLTARFPARIDQLFVNYTGIPVKPGDHLARIYSPELVTAQRELLTAFSADPASTFTHIAREKLRRWDLLPDQIEALIADGTPSEAFELRAPIGGVVIDKNIKEGDYVKTGDPLFRIADLRVLWLHLSAFESDLAWLRFGQQVTFAVEAYPGETFAGRIAFIAPEIDRHTRTTAIRVNVPNPDGRLKPGMLARGQVQALLAGDGQVIVPELAGKWIGPMHPEIISDHPGQCPVCGMDLVPAASLGFAEPVAGQAPLVVPASAVLRTGRRAVVYVALPDRDHPAFEGREVVLGAKAGQFYIVRSGLAAGDQVVTNGAFKIDSALQILAKPSMMNPPPPDTGPGAMDPTMAMPGTDDAHPGGTLSIEPALAAKALPAYFQLQQALGTDDFSAAQDALRAIMTVTGHTGPLPDLIHRLLDADDLEAIRRPHFETLSNAFAAAVRAAPGTFKGEVHLMHCPMVYADRGADWLQSTNQLLNPYFGRTMPTCGEDRGLLNSIK